MYRLVVLSALIGTSLTLSAQTGVDDGSPNPLSFQLQRDTYPNYGSMSVVQGDFNNDGKLDIVTGGGATPTTITLREGKGDGTFSAPITVGQADSAEVDGLVAADLNHDGKLDIVSLSVAGTFDVYFGNGDGTFEAPISFTTLNAPRSAAAGDFYSNGLLDIAIGDESGKIEIFKNIGGKSFSIANSFTVGDGSPISRVRAGDFNDDGVTDLAVLDGSAAYALWSNGQGTMTAAELGTYSNPGDLSVGDVNQDGNADVLVTYGCNGSSQCGGIDVYEGQASTEHLTVHHAVTDESISTPARPLAVDVNGDGIADLVAESGGSVPTGLYVWLGNPNGTFSQVPSLFTVSSSGGGGLTAGDFNRDGMIDFAQTLPGDGMVEIYLNATHRAACATGMASPTVTVCQPVNGAYVNSPLTVQANATDPAGVTSMQEYIDGTLKYSQHVNSFDTTFTAALGTHALTTKAWDAKGTSFRSNRTVTVYSGTPTPTCAAALGAAAICLPTGSSSTSPVRILANGYTAAVPTAAQLYVDGKLVVNSTGCGALGVCEGGTSYVDTTETLSSGTHSLTFKLWDANGKTYVATKSVTVE